MLGYTIERVDSVDANGLAWDTTYEVLSADGNTMLGGEHPTLHAAQNFVLWHELEVAAAQQSASVQVKDVSVENCQVENLRNNPITGGVSASPATTVVRNSGPFRTSRQNHPRPSTRENARGAPPALPGPGAP